MPSHPTQEFEFKRDGRPLGGIKQGSDFRLGTTNRRIREEVQRSLGSKCSNLGKR
jgi:hypothetical protein